METVKRFGLLILFLFVAQNLQAQFNDHSVTSSYNIGLSSPTASSISKFGDSPVSYATGTPSIEIPLYNAQSRDLNIPISLSYHASGIRVSDVPSWVGLGWALNAGGVITRTMRGLPDEATHGFENKGWMAAHYSSASGDTIRDGAQWVLKQDFLRNVSLGQWDAEPDEYNISLPGLSAKFIVDHNGEVKLLPHKNINVEQVGSNWKVTAEDGTIYYFEEKETTFTETVDKSGFAFGGILPQTYVSSWYLSKIEPPFVNDQITLTYDASQPSTERTFSISHTRTNNLIEGSCSANENNVIIQNRNITYNKYLEEIQTPTVKIEFITDDDGAITMKTRLREIWVTSVSSSDTLRKFKLDYNNTGSPNRHYLISVQELGPNGAEKPPYEMDYFSTYSLPSYSSAAIDHWGYYNGENSNTSLIPAVSSTQFGSLSGADRDPSFSHARTGTLKKLSYPTGGHAEYTYEANQYYDYTTSSNETGGGLRIKTIKIHDGIDQANDIVKTYTYNHPTISGRSSGYLAGGPLELYEYFPSGSGNPCPYVVRKSTAAGVIGGTPVAYDWVREYIGTVSTNEGYSQIKAQHSEHNGRDAGTWKRSKILERQEYDSGANKVFETINTYNYTAHLIGSTDGLESKVDWVGTSDTTYTATVFSYDSYESRLVETENRTYDSNGSNYYSTHEEYNYDSFDAGANMSPLRSIKRINSNDDERITEYRYAFEENTGMESANMLSQIYSVTVKNASGVKSKSWKVWDNNIPGAVGDWLPKEFWKWKGGSVTQDPGTSNAIKISTVIKYDNHGNPLEIQDANTNLTKYYYGSNSNPFSSSLINGASGFYLTGIQKVQGSVNTPSSGDDLYIEAEYNAQGLVSKIIDENDDEQTFVYDDFGRLEEIYNANNEIVTSYGYHYSSSDSNRVETWTHYDPNNSSNVTKSISYLDGLGRQIQTQTRGGGETIVSASTYNKRGLLEVVSRPFQVSSLNSYLSDPFGAAFTPPGLTGWNYSSALDDEYDGSSGGANYPFTYIAYEDSPLSRKITTQGVGGSDYTDTTSYSLNNSETFTINGKTWGQNELSKTVVTDPDGKEIITYADGWGQTIVSGVNMNPGGDDILNKSSSDLVTYFEYDLRGNLIRVEDPRGLATTYTYNELGQLISKKLPDQQYSIDYRYDDAGNLRFTQDANHKSLANDISHSLSFSTSFSKTLTATTSGKLTVYFCIYDLYMDSFDVELIDVDNGNTVIDSWVITTSGAGGCVASAGNPEEYTVGTGTYRLEGQARDSGEPIVGGFGEFGFVSDDVYTYNKYDDLGRLVETGEYSDGVSFASASVNSSSFPTTGDPNIKYFYDGDEAYSGSLAPDNLKGRVSKVEYRDLSVASSSWGNTWYSYNTLGLVEWVVQDPPGLSEKKIEYTYDELGRATQIDFQAGVSGQQFYQRFSYDALGRLDKVETSTNGYTWIKDAEYTGFMADGQVKEMKLGNSAVQTVDYTYTVQGWLDKINNPSSIGSDKFGLDLGYDFNGNIDQQKWKQPGASNTNILTYNYSYDGANRLALATFSGSGYSSGYYNVNPTYDKSGNITYITRGGHPDYYELGIDIGSGSNRILEIENYDQLTYESVNYDANGNLTEYETIGITSVDYDWRNLPAQLYKGGITLQYAYDAEGSRVKKKVSGGTDTHYIRGANGETVAVYQGGSAEFFNILAGAEIIGTYDGSQRRFFLKDHLGSIRTTVDQGGAVDGYDDYYPFGLVMPGRSSNSANPNDNYKYTGHERDDEVNLTLDYMGARYYDPIIGRFLQIDPYAAKFPNVSPYVYALNNPVNMWDPDGRAPVGCPACFVVSWTSLNIYTHQKIKSVAGVNDAEAKVIKRNLHRGLTLYQTGARREVAEKLSQNSGLKGPRGGAQDALRHSLFNAMNTQTLGAGLTKQLGDAHEEGQTPQIEVEMDLFNNAIGREVGENNPLATPKQLANILLNKMKDGELKVIVNGELVKSSMSEKDYELFKNVINDLYVNGKKEYDEEDN
ncbi:RHS repeat domain-containing protein [Gracilimonas sediminicola]|uniref:RHS repeat domain-containing protein n=1 Tax=Gracilimonas sediminicola TaxID=2952158 RepID=UPI0038D44FA6